MFQALNQVIYLADDIQKARTWYSQVLGIEPCFDNSCYVGFKIGHYELGLLLNNSNHARKLDRTVTYWKVENAYEAHQRLIELGASRYSDVTARGDGVMVAIVVDPFGNPLGIIEQAKDEPARR